MPVTGPTHSVLGAQIVRLEVFELAILHVTHEVAFEFVPDAVIEPGAEFHDFAIELLGRRLQLSHDRHERGHRTASQVARRFPFPSPRM